ncbi:hypothetical protein ACU4GD_23490 [Cupriavidus basilensis]
MKPPLAPGTSPAPTTAAAQGCAWLAGADPMSQATLRLAAELTRGAAGHAVRAARTARLAATMYAAWMPPAATARAALRTIGEIAAWSGSDEAERRRIWLLLPSARRATRRTGGALTAPAAAMRVLPQHHGVIRP